MISTTSLDASSPEPVKFFASAQKKRKPQSLLLPHNPDYGEVYSPETQSLIASCTKVPRNLILNKENWRNHPDICARTEVIFGSWGIPRFDGGFLKAFPRLKAIFYAAGSIKHLVTDEFWDRNIVISSAADANAVPVAEFTLAQIILGAKRAWPASREYHGERKMPARNVSSGLYGNTVGLVSLGKIGSLVAEYLKSFRVRVLAYDPYASQDLARSLDVTLVGLDELFSSSSIVSCHAPVLPETIGLLQWRHFAALPHGATFINTARGIIVNETDLFEVFKARPDLTALLDVTHPEPPPPDSPIFSLPNVFLTPHIAGSVGVECHRMGAYMFEEYKRFSRGEPLRHQVTKECVALQA